MEQQILIYQYLQDDQTIINNLIDLSANDDKDDLSDDSRSLFNDFDQRILHDLNTAVDETIQEPQVPTTLTRISVQAISAAHLEYVHFVPEYPKTHPQGHAYVIDTRALHPSIVEKPLSTLSYCYRIVGKKARTYSNFLRCDVTKYHHLCSGAKACQWLDLELAGIKHTEVSSELFDQMGGIHNGLVRTPDPHRRSALSLYQNIQQRFKVNRACTRPSDTCKPAFYRSSDSVPFIGCCNFVLSNAGEHFYLNLSQKATQINLQLLEELLQSESDVQYETCGVIDQQATRRPHCGVSHPQGPGTMKKLDCNVSFDVLVPVDRTACPYIVFLSRGVHVHPPPPPNKPPQVILDEILDLIKRMQNPDLTSRFFLKSPALKEFCRKYSGQTISQIHNSFVNDQDAFSAIIQKQNVLLSPEATGFNRVHHEYTHNQEYKKYARRIYNDNHGIMIICGLDEQIKFLSTLDSFELINSYNRVKGGFHEVIFATFLPERGQVVTLLRVFMNQETATSHKLLFQRVFQLVAAVSGKAVQFDYMHNSGLKAIVIDMCAKQLSGLGHFLHELDPDQRPWQWQLMNIIIFNRVHFMRTLSKLIKPDSDQHDDASQSSSSTGTMLSRLLDCDTRDEYYRLIESIQENNDPEIRSWAEHKKHPVIAAGLNKSFSLINPSIFDEIRNSTKTVDQSLYETYWAGYYETLLGATMRSAFEDETNIIKYKYRLESYPRPDTQEVTRKRKRPVETGSSSHIPDDEDFSLYFEAVTSRNVPPRRQRSPQSRGRAREREEHSRPVSRERQVFMPRAPRPQAPPPPQVPSNLQLQSQLQDLQFRQQLLELQRQELQLRREKVEIEKLELDNEFRRRELAKKDSPGPVWSK